MGVTVVIEVSKEDVEMLSQTMDYTDDEDLKDFIERFLRNTDVSSDIAIHTVKEICKVNPFSMA